MAVVAVPSTAADVSWSAHRAALSASVVGRSADGTGIRNSTAAKASVASTPTTQAPGAPSSDQRIDPANDSTSAATSSTQSQTPAAFRKATAAAAVSARTVQ